MMQVHQPKQKEQEDEEFNPEDFTAEDFIIPGWEHFIHIVQPIPGTCLQES
jgi:hypothetical protein